MGDRRWWLIFVVITWAAIAPQLLATSHNDSPTTNPATAPSTIDPNSIQSPEPGWGSWYPKAATSPIPYDAGFSNSELGGFLDFQAACTQAMGIPPEQVPEQMDGIPYWFRLNDLVNQLGTGNVEYGCWVNGTLRLSQTITAIRTDIDSVSCWRSSRRLVVYAEPTTTSKQVGIVRRDSTVDPGGYPASMLESEGQTWVYIVSPVNGWLLYGQSGRPGTLSRCQPSPTS